MKRRTLNMVQMVRKNETVSHSSKNFKIILKIIATIFFKKIVAIIILIGVKKKIF